MRVIVETRASTILYKLALARPKSDGIYLVPANACPVVPLSIMKACRDVEFIDIDKQTLVMDQATIIARLNDKTKPSVAGVIFIRTYGAIDGYTTNFSEIRHISKDTIIIDDRCASVPELDDGNFRASMAHVHLYSTGYGKYVDLGKGGYAYMEPSVEYESNSLVDVYYAQGNEKRLRDECDACWKQHRLLEVSKFNDWLDTVSVKNSWDEYRDQIAVMLEKVVLHKEKSGLIYRSIIPETLFIGEEYNHWRHQVRVNRKDDLLKKIFADGNFASGHYNVTARLFTKNKFAVSEQLYAEVINLFNDFYVNEKQVEAVARVVASHCE